MKNMHEEKCKYCGASMKQYWQRVSPLLVRTLIKFRASVNEKGINEIHVPEDLELTKTEYNNFQKLRFHGLVAKVNKNGEHKSGYWLLTKRGADFLNGKIEIPASVKTFRNKIVEYDPKNVTVRDVLRSTPYLDTIDTIAYDIKPEEIEQQEVFSQECLHLRKELVVTGENTAKAICKDCGKEL